MIPCRPIFLAFLLVLYVATTPTRADEAPPQKHAYTGILSVKPVEKAAERDGDSARVRGLIPATGFLINHNTILTARHVQQQSPLALIYSLDETGQRAKQYTAYQGEPFAERTEKTTPASRAPQTDQTPNAKSLDYDVARYILQESITDTTPLAPYEGTVKPGAPIKVTGVVFMEGHYSTRTATGRISEIQRATNGAHLLLLDIKSEHGMSGAPVTLHPSGKVIGVLMGEFRRDKRRHIVAWSLPKSIAPNLQYQPAK